MPLLKRKAIKPVPPPNPNDFDENLPVFMMPFTNEIFTSYEDYLNRYMFYQQKTWQCETTGKSGLTYKQALESEHKEKSMVANKFPPQLRKPLLQFVQFQTARIDGVVEDAYAKFKNLYYLNEPVNVSWDGSSYSAVIRKVVPQDEWTTVQDGAEEPEVPGQYLVQVLDQKGRGIPDMERVVDCSLLSRDRLAFNKNILRKYIRECATKESYIGAPWMVKPFLCKKYDVETKLPSDLNEARNRAILKINKRKTPTDPAPELSALKKAKKEAADKAKESSAEATPVAVETKTIKYPIEDLDLDQKLITKVSDENAIAVRPTAAKESAIPQECFEDVIMAWQFLNTFSAPLKLSPFGFKDLQDSLTHTDVQHPSVMISEYHSTLMNVIIQDRLKGIAKPIFATSSGAPTAGTREDRENSVMTDDEDSTTDDGDFSVDYVQQRQKYPHCPINERVVVVGQGWDEKQVSSSRQGWEAVLVGLINELGSFDAIPTVDRILNHLVPSDTTTKDDVEFLYPALPYEDKVRILVFLVETASGTSAIRTYMEQCREQLKELRLEKFELNKERRRLQAERAEFERQDSTETKTTTDSASEAPSAVATPKSNEIESDAESKESLSRTESRQEKLKRQQQEREQEEARRAQDLQRQKALSKAKSAEQKLRLDAKKKLMDQEQALARKEDQVDRDTQRYAIARVKSLGKDRFFNQYWYFDGITMTHATDRLYVQSPSFLDLETMRTREDKDKILKRQAFEDPSCGLGELLKAQESEIIRGITADKAAKEAAKEKKLQMEKERENDTDDEGDVKTDHHNHAGHGGGALTNGASQTFSDETKAVEHMTSHWSYYSEPEQIDQLLMWLNAKGVREHSLISAIERQYDSIVGGMQRRHQDLVNQVQREQHRRSTRTKTVQASEGYLGYVNKLNK
ncbi:hypothetical protein EMPS_04612 [Entomortierella parvispora]|uniref:WAC domain-containing protein n=1 Tax=Entomortierella parvispora TaxID=205924 RepID=A0A9P3H8V3_9FUNG|nr:hypothetical protein EMPS_04612 [Entomortierella parvispora]